MASKVHAEATTGNGDARTAALFFDDLVRCETRLYNALNDRLRERYGLVTSQFEFLRHLREHPDARVGDIAATFAIGVGATSKGADRLQAAGWVRRIPNPADRRSSLLQLTPTGLQLLLEAEETVDETLRNLVTSTLAPTQLRSALESLSVLRSALEREQVGTPAG